MEVIPINPFLQLREKNNWSQSECARIIGVDVRAVARLESGLFTSPLPVCVDYWVNHSANTLPEILTAYEDFVILTRKNNARVYGTLHVNLSSSTHPFRVLRASHNPPLTLTQAVKLMCVPLDTVQYWEKKWRTQHGIPKSILLALNQMGYTQQELAKFQFIYKEWRQLHLQDAKPKQPRRRTIKVNKP